jgi:hypothetical protein
MRLEGAKNTSVRRIHAAWTKQLYTDETTWRDHRDYRRGGDSRLGRREDEITAITAEELLRKEQRKVMLPRLTSAAKIKRLELRKRHFV